MAPRILFVANTSFVLWNFRRNLILAAHHDGFHVTVMARPDDTTENFERSNIPFIPLDMIRGWNAPLKECATLFTIRSLLKHHQWDIAQTFTIKPNIYLPLSLAFSKKRPIFVSTVTGMGHLYTHNSALNRLSRKIVNNLYRFYIQKRLSAITFQNQDDQHYFIRHRLIPHSLPKLTLPGSGVDTDHFHPHSVSEEGLNGLRKKFGISKESKIILFAGRLLKDKGILDFVEAARRVRDGGCSDAQFVVVGSIDEENPAGISKSSIEQWCQEKIINYWGHLDDVRPALAASHVVVLPSYYREGMPKILLEAASFGKPIITCNGPGCRETVIDGYNGYLIPPQNPAALAEKIIALIQKPQLAQKMGQNSRDLAVNNFDEKLIISRMLGLYHDLYKVKGEAL